MTAASGNLLEAVDAVLTPPSDSDARGATTFHRPHAADAMVPPNGRTSGSGIDRLAVVERTWQEDGRCLLRFRDDAIRDVGAQLEAGAASAMSACDLAAGEEIVVDFLDSNATKALHVGHLRNLAIGHALAAVADAAGASVVRQMQLGDCGRGMGEALAGYLHEVPWRSPAQAGLKSDHFVGECYTRYVQAAQRRDGADAPGAADPPDPALSREDLDHDDEAERLLRRWEQRDPQITGLWRTLRQWCLDGQLATLTRLGIHLDRVLCESDFLAEMPAIRDRALAQGIVSHTPDGAIAYETGREEYPRLLMNRPDGFATQHLRYISLWHATGNLMGGACSIQLIGDEWRWGMVYSDEVLRRLAGDEPVHPSLVLLYGMVRVDEGVPKSSSGGGWLVDDLLGEIAATAAARDLLGRHDRVGERELVAIAALGHCLGRPIAKPLDLLRADVCNVRTNLGWAIACAWAQAWAPDHDGTPDPQPDDADYRFLVVQSQAHRGLLRRALREHDVHSLARFYGHLSRWFLDTPPRPRLARAMRSVLGTGLAALGLTARSA